MCINCDRAQLLTQMLLKQGYVAPRLKSSLQILNGCHYDPVDRYEISISQTAMDLSLLPNCFLAWTQTQNIATDE
jgi:hypothetical protein